MINTESESMTIKRLEIALRKMDMELLKNAAYKLHEKFHSGHEFQYTKELKQIFDYIEEEKIEGEVANMVTSTIKEILQDKPQLTTAAEFYKQEPQMSQPMPVSSYIDTPPVVQQSFYMEPETTQITDNAKPLYSRPEAVETTDRVLFFYEEKNPEIDLRLINEYKKDPVKNVKMALNILNADLSNLNKILSTASTFRGTVEFITTSMNVSLLKQVGDFNIPGIYETGADWNFYPIYGQSNIFECQNCSHKFLNTNFEHRAVAFCCPKCSEISYPQLNFAASMDGNMLQNAFDALLNSSVWVLINPSYESQVQNLLSICYKNSTPKKIYLLTQDNERKEFYRQMFYKINQNCEIKGSYLTDEAFCEDFIKCEMALGVC